MTKCSAKMFYEVKLVDLKVESKGHIVNTAYFLSLCFLTFILNNFHCLINLFNNVFFFS